MMCIISCLSEKKEGIYSALSITGPRLEKKNYYPHRFYLLFSLYCQGCQIGLTPYNVE